MPRTFEEYDSDYMHRGDHERVTQALRGFGRFDDERELGTERSTPDATFIDVAIKRITSPARSDVPFWRGLGG
jgi:hypothetical protein